MGRRLMGASTKTAASRAFQAAPWIGGWLVDSARKSLMRRPDGERHLLFAICDHFEPLHGKVPVGVGLARVRAWRDRYPALAARFRDATGRPPRHTFFFPGEEYAPAFLDPLGELVERGVAEVEVHLHHDGDTRETLRRKLTETLDAFAGHGVVPRRAGRFAWSFIHGNWALANGRPDRRWCGVDDELELLHELGCYADFTFPSAPDPCQPSVVNAVYYPRNAARRRGYARAERVRVGSAARDRVLLVQGPVALVARGSRARWPRIEAAALHHGDPPTARRLAHWIAQWVHVEGRPEWTFVKLHSHGAPEKNASVMLGAPAAGLHEALAELAGSGWRLHYVTAREMYNVARAAMAGLDGSPAAYFDYAVPPCERARSRPS
jgi:hypothetical protein